MKDKSVMILIVLLMQLIFTAASNSYNGDASVRGKMKHRVLEGDQPVTTSSPSTSYVPSTSAIPSDTPTLRSSELSTASGLPSFEPSMSSTTESDLLICTVDYYLYEPAENAGDDGIYSSISNDEQLSYRACQINIESVVTCHPPRSNVTVPFNGWVRIKLFYFNETKFELTGAELGVKVVDRVEKKPPYFLLGNKNKQVFLSSYMNSGDYSIQSTLLGLPNANATADVITAPVHFTYYPCINW